MESIAKQPIAFAVHAPSEQNTQPSQFSVEQDAVWIYPDLSRRLPVVDRDDHALFIRPGCALDHLVVAAAQPGRVASVDYAPTDDPEESLRFRLSEGAHEGEEFLFRAIPERKDRICSRREAAPHSARRPRRAIMPDPLPSE